MDAGTGITISVHTSLCCSCINNYGMEEQKQKYLRPLVDGSKVGCFGLTEANAGSDVQGAQTVAVKDGDEWVINGSKSFTTIRLCRYLRCICYYGPHRSHCQGVDRLGGEIIRKACAIHGGTILRYETTH